MQDRAPRVAAGVDARDDEVGRVAERAEPRRAHAQPGRTVERERGDALAPGQLDLLGVDVLVGVEQADRGADAAAVAVGRGDDDLEAGVAQRGGHDVQARALRRRRRW